MKALKAVPVLLLSLFAAGCAASTSSSEEEVIGGQGAAATADDEVLLEVRVVGGAEEKMQAEYGKHERLFGTAHADDKMKAEMLPRVRAQAAQSLEDACATVSWNAGHVAGSPKDELVRAERIFTPTEFIVQVSNAQTCLVSKGVLQPHAKELVKMLEAKDRWNALAALRVLGEPGAKEIIARIDSFITPEGKLDLSEEAAHGGANWTINFLLPVISLLADTKTQNADAIPVLQKLRAAFAGENGASYNQDQVDRAIAKLLRTAQ